MTLRRYREMKASRGTVIPAPVRSAIHARDNGCVGPRVGMPGDCFGSSEIDHVRASGGIGMKSESTVANGVLLCSTHHLERTLNGRKWRPVLLDYIGNAARNLSTPSEQGDAEDDQDATPRRATSRW